MSASLYESLVNKNVMGEPAGALPDPAPFTYHDIPDGNPDSLNVTVYNTFENVIQLANVRINI